MTFNKLHSLTNVPTIAEYVNKNILHLRQQYKSNNNKVDFILFAST